MPTWSRAMRGIARAGLLATACGVPGGRPDAGPTPRAGDRLAFVSTRDGAPHVYVTNLDGSNARRFGAFDGSMGAPAWTTDGARLVFVGRVALQTTVYIAADDGVAPRAVTNETDGVAEDDPAPWPGGTRIVVAAGDRLATVALDGTDRRALGVAVAGTVVTHPSVSPDGAWVAYLRAAEPGAAGDVYVVRADGTDDHALTSGALDASPSVSPDGAWIAFVSQRDGAPGVWVMRADGTDARRVSPRGGRDEDPAWSPDGTRIVYASERAGLEQLYVVAASGGSATRVTFSSADESAPTWWAPAP